MEYLVLLFIVGVIALLARIRKGDGLGDQLNEGLEDRIRVNEMRAQMTEENGTVDNDQLQQIMNNTINEKPDTLGLIHSILTEIGCQPKRDDENTLQVLYQGENFVIKTGGPYAQIWDPGWGSISIKDPNLEQMKLATNMTNFDFGPTIVWTAPNDEGIITLHSKRDIVLFPTFPHKNDYVKSVLDSFFEKKENMRSQLHSLINSQQETPKTHRPVGFATTSEE